MADGNFLDNIPDITPQLARSAYNVIRKFCKYNDCTECPFFQPRGLHVNGCYFTQIGAPNDWRDMNEE